jgi:hypothetical protein
MLPLPSEAAFYTGSLLLISAMIGVGVHLIMLSVVHERTEKYLPFIMSLPISIKEYTLAKISANMGAFLLPWTILFAASLLLLGNHTGLPQGLIPFTVILLVEILVAYTIMLGVALVSESLGWTIFAIVICNFALNLFLYWTSNLPAIAEHMQGATAIWTPTIAMILAAEGSAVLLILSLIFFFQGRKRDFL